MTVDAEGLEALCGIAADAAAEIMAVYAGDIRSWSKDDSSPLTEADLRADRVIRAGLQARFPGVYILSEESAAAETPPAAPREFFLVDPLDGTKEFLKRNGEFTVNIALVRDGRPVAGVVGVPATGEQFAGIAGQGAWKQDAQGRRPIATRAPAAGEVLRIMGSRSHGGDALGPWLERLGRPHELVAAGSSLKFCRLAEGAAHVYPRMGPTSQWDTAAGQAVLEAAGGLVLDPSGQPLAYGLDRPILNAWFVALASPSLPVPPLG